MKKSLFILGSQRSGTTMLSDSLGRAPDVESHGEGSKDAMVEFRLRPIETIRAVIARSPRAVVAFKPLCDSQWASRILREIDGSRVVWAYRPWRDVVRSTVKLWPGHSRDTLQRFAADDLDWLQWRAEGMTPKRRREIGGHWHTGASDEECAAVLWAFRNRLFFDQELERWPELVLPLCYDAVLADPEGRVRALAAFAGFTFDAGMVADIAPRAARDRPLPVPAPIAAMCDEQFARLRALDAAR